MLKNEFEIQGDLNIKKMAIKARKYMQKKEEKVGSTKRIRENLRFRGILALGINRVIKSQSNFKAIKCRRLNLGLKNHLSSYSF